MPARDQVDAAAVVELERQQVIGLLAAAGHRPAGDHPYGGMIWVDGRP